MWTWRFSVTIQPKGGGARFMRSVDVYSLELTDQVDDTVGQVSPMVAARWPGFDLVYIHGGRLVPRSAA